MGKKYYGKDASAGESTRDLETKKWIAVVQHKLGLGFACDLFGPFDSKGKADAHTAEVVKALTNPGLSKRGGKAYNDAMAHRSQVLARHKSFRVSDGSVQKTKDGTYIGMLSSTGERVHPLPR